MQDIRALGGGGGGGPLFGVDRRLRPHNTLNQQQPLKCPRCESLNTKFCYYNNYNLSQPRHFCKGCRRYWTKGGVLRNVPVGGGCRKAKRSTKPKQLSQPDSSAAAAPPAKTNSHSSSESSSLTATTAAAAGEVVSGGSGSGSGSSLKSAVPPPLFSYPPETSFFLNPAPSNLNFNPSAVDGGSIFPEIGSFTGLMTASNDPAALVFDNIGDISKYGVENENEGRGVVNQQNEDMQYLGDQTAQIEYSGNKISNGGVGAVDWQAAGGGNGSYHHDQGVEDEGIFDLMGSVDQAYWNQQITHWPNHHHSFHFLP